MGDMGENRRNKTLWVTHIWVWVHLDLGKEKKSIFTYLNFKLILLVSELEIFHSKIVMLLLQSDWHLLINACNLRNIYNIALLIIRSS
jgi:hypothetical protein